MTSLTTTHELLHTYVDNLLGGRINSMLQGGNQPDSRIHRWIEDKSQRIAAWGKRRNFNPEIKSEIVLDLSKKA